MRKFFFVKFNLRGFVSLRGKMVGYTFSLFNFWLIYFILILADFHFWISWLRLPFLASYFFENTVGGDVTVVVPSVALCIFKVTRPNSAAATDSWAGKKMRELLIRTSKWLPNCICTLPWLFQVLKMFIFCFSPHVGFSMNTSWQRAHDNVKHPYNPACWSTGVYFVAVHVDSHGHISQVEPISSEAGA